MTRRPSGWLCPSWLLLLAACSGDHAPTATVVAPPTPFQLVSAWPLANATLYLNDAPRWVFNQPVDLDTASANTVVFTVFDAVTGEARSDAVAGTFRHARHDGAEDGMTLEFVPRLPSDAPYTDGGLVPRRRYVATLAGAGAAATLRDRTGRALQAGASVTWFTPTGSTAPELFRNPAAGGPRVLGVEVLPTLVPGDATHPPVVPLGLLAYEPLEVHLRFDQPLDPAQANLPQRQSVDPARRAERRRGPVYLEYDDVELGRQRWIPTQTLLERNHQDGAEVVLVPDGVLPNNALVRVVVAPELADLGGESNATNAGWQRVAATFRTEASYPSRYDALRVDFDQADVLDAAAVFLDPPARVQSGGLRAAFEFPGRPTSVDLVAAGDVVLNTDSVPGGAFSFRHVTIPAGATVRGVGQNPLLLLASGDVRVDGILAVDGGKGERALRANSALFPTAGGVGVCTGGNGGNGNPQTTQSSLAGEAGYGPGAQPGLGGQGGRIGCGVGGVKRGSGGGGGGGVTQGDPLYNDGNSIGQANFVQWRGTGGTGYTNGSNTPNLPGGAAGLPRGRDGDPDNDFVGSTVDLARHVRITGEFPSLLGGAGGGGGGNDSTGAPCQSGPIGFLNDNRGGGGGAGGGVLVVQALGTITVGPTGRISADGGPGDGGEFLGSNNQGGGGGGGAGGVVVLMTATAIVLHRHGGTYFNPTGARDYAFAVSADGGASLRGDFGGAPIFSKYPVRDYAAGVETNSGGYGGMGLVQLMAPPGSNTDGTNTVLDDNIHVIDSDGVTRMTGSEKQRFLAWPGVHGQDDAGTAVPNYGGGGDIRPRPLLLPPTFGRYARARTRWLATGATVRRELSAPDDLPRGLVVQPPELVSGPDYAFPGTAPQGSAEQGWLSYDRSTGLLAPPVVFGGLAVAELGSLGGQHLGRAVHRVVLQGTPLGTTPDRHAHLRLLLRDPFGARLGDFAILAHGSSELLLEPADGALPEQAATADVVARCVDVWTGLHRGLGPTRTTATGALPMANVRIGFAFHLDPASPDLRIAGQDQRRYPVQLDTFVYDLGNAQVRAALRALHLSFVQVDVRFSLDYTDQAPDDQGGGHLLVDGERPEIRSLVVPYRF